MTSDVRTLIDEYHKWLKDKTMLREIGEWLEITTPYLDRHNDYLQIFAKRDNGNFVLTDDGYVINDLISSGCKLESKRRQDLLNMTLNGFGVQLESNNLKVRATPQNFSQRKHDLIQAMLAVNDLFYLASPIVTSVFFDDVAAWLEIFDVRYTPRVKFTGKTGYDYLFDFVIPKSRLQPERIIKAINRPSQDTAQAFILSWLDTRDARPETSRAYAFLNDLEQEPSGTVLDALQSYEVRPVLWSRREQVRHELAA